MSNVQLKHKSEILKAEEEILQAMKNADVSKLSILLHDDLLFSIPNGQTITKAMDLETYSSGNMKIRDIKVSNQDIRHIEDTAVVSMNLEMKGSYFDYVIDGMYKVIRVWKLMDSQWKVIAGSSTQIEENI
ncbi:nuclear transport factor 2 family protein [Seonamhaeicola marinus]|uniref:Nuclear transport factor 2 family protein n=1 Tax=Seonamhaeicola marinus TaxID=1912246 RepID=A0A5D0HV88_9FLAO|nr:nuclear transport factor 2 family protein [Seonamhaeicola marinus]TYA74790.1 nuclear transport factor 2 family protein [Seonamhaeicola marinus]